MTRGSSVVCWELSVCQLSLERQIGTPWRPGSGASEAVGVIKCPIQRNNMTGSGNQDKDWLQYRERTAQRRHGERHKELSAG